MSDDVLELLKTAPEPPMSVDPYAAMAAGRRARGRRRRIVAAAAAAATLAVAAGSALIAGRGGELPPHPSSASPTPSSAPRSLTAKFQLLQGQFTANLDSAVTTITLRRSGDPAGTPSLGLPVPPSAGGASCRVSPTLLLQACAVRSPVREGIITYTDPRTPDVTVSPPVVGRFSVPDVSVVVVDAPAHDLPSLRGAAWVLDDGTVADSSSAPVPQAHARAVPVTVFASSPDGSVVLGLRSDNTDGWGATSGPDSTGVTRTGMGDATGDYYAYLFPAAAVSGQVRAPGTATVRGQEVLVLGGRKVFVAHLTGVMHFSGPTVEWVDKNGGVHSLP